MRRHERPKLHVRVWNVAPRHERVDDRPSDEFARHCGSGVSTRHSEIHSGLRLPEHRIVRQDNHGLIPGEIIAVNTGAEKSGYVDRLAPKATGKVWKRERDD